MWDEFESSARLLPSNEEKKEPKATATDETAATLGEDSNATASVARVDEKSADSPEAKTADSAVTWTQDHEPELADWKYDSPQATFAFYGNPQATFAFDGNNDEEEAADETKQETPFVAEDEPEIAAPAGNIQAEQSAVHLEERVQTTAPVVEERFETAVLSAAPVVEEEPETSVSTAAAVAEGKPASAVSAEPLALEEKSPPISSADEKIEHAVPVHHRTDKAEQSAETRDIKDVKAAGSPGGSKQKSLSLRGEKLMERPFRVKLRGSILVLVRLPNKRSLRGAFHQLSTSGGVIHLEKPLDEKLEVELIFHIQEKTIRNKAQMLFPMWATQGWMQPFRFIDLADKSREVLDASLKTFLGDASKGASAGA